MGDTISFRQQLSTTSFVACGLEITVNYYSICTWQKMRNRTSWPMLCFCPDWAQGTKRGLPLPGCGTIVPVLWLLFSKLSMLPSFQLLSGNSLKSRRASYCFDSMMTIQYGHTDDSMTIKVFLIRITSSCEIFTILFNFCSYLGLDNFPR